MEKRKYIILGILGVLFFGIGDWLLGYVDVSPIADTAFKFIRAGHGASYNTLKVTVTMALATLGFFFYYPGLIHMADIVKDETGRGRLRYMLGTSAFILMVIHTYYSVNVYVYAWMMQNGGEALASKLSDALGNAMLPGVALGYIPLATPLVVHLVEIARGRTSLNKSALLFHPVVWMVIFNIVANILPESPFSYGLYTFAMNAGMLVWFVYLLVIASRNGKIPDAWPPHGLRRDGLK